MLPHWPPAPNINAPQSNKDEACPDRGGRSTAQPHGTHCELTLGSLAMMEGNGRPASAPVARSYRKRAPSSSRYSLLNPDALAVCVPQGAETREHWGASAMPGARAAFITHARFAQEAWNVSADEHTAGAGGAPGGGARHVSSSAGNDTPRVAPPWAPGEAAADRSAASRDPHVSRRTHGGYGVPASTGGEKHVHTPPNAVRRISRSPRCAARSA